MFVKVKHAFAVGFVAFTTALVSSILPIQVARSGIAGCTDGMTFWSRTNQRRGGKQIAGNSLKGRLSMREVAPRQTRNVPVVPLGCDAVARISAVEPKLALHGVDHHIFHVRAAETTPWLQHRQGVPGQ